MLGIDGERLKDDQNVAVLASLPALEHLHVYAPMDSATLARLRPLAQSLRGFTSWNAAIAGAGWKPIFDLKSLEYVFVRGSGQLDGPTLLQFAEMPRLRHLQTGLAPEGRKYTTADIAAFRQRRPDVQFTEFDGKATVEYPAFTTWPGKEDGQGITPWPKDSPPPAVIPFTPAEAKKLQESWAQARKLPVE